MKMKFLLFLLSLPIFAQVTAIPAPSGGGGGGGTPGGSDGQVQYKVGTNFGASPNLFWDSANNRLGIGTASPVVPLDINGSSHFSSGFYVGGGSGNVAVGYYQPGLQLGLGHPITFRTTSAANSSAHAGLDQDGTGIAKVSDGSTGYGILRALRYQLISSTEPTCASDTRATFNFLAGGTGVADALGVCLKNSSDAYAWTPLGGSGTIDASQIVSGQIAKARQNNQTVYADQNITYSSTSDQDMRLGNLRVPSGLFSAIPAAASYSGGYYVITDGNGINCTAGGGSTATACFSNGSSWVLISGTNATANPTVTFTSQTSVTFTHNLGTTTPIIQCYDASGTPVLVEPSQIASTSTSVSTITFASSQSGKCVANATGGGGGGGGGSGDITDIIAGTGISVSSGGGPQPTVTLNINGGVTQTCSSGNHFSSLTSAGIATCTADSGGGGGGTPGGTSGQLQINSSGSFAGRSVGTGLSDDGSSLSVATATVPTYLTGIGTLDFGSIAQSACSELTFTLTGAGTGDSIAPGWPSDLDAGFAGSMFVSATNTVTVRLCKITSGSTDPSSKNYRATIVRSF